MGIPHRFNTDIDIFVGGYIHVRTFASYPLHNWSINIDIDINMIDIVDRVHSRMVY